MASFHTISIANQRGANANYAIFMEPPKTSSGAESWMNVWQTSYAWVGTVPSRLSPGLVVNRGMSVPAPLGSTYEMTIKDSFPTLSQSSPSASRDSFEIKTGHDFTVPNNTFLIGLGKINNRGQIAPVAVLAPFPGSNIQLAPKTKFYVTESQYVSGEIVDYDSVIKEGATIDSSAGEGQGKLFALAVQGADGKFTVKYSDSAFDS